MNCADENEIGVCVLFSCGSFDGLITGDVGSETELRLTERLVLPDIELLVAGHHGSVGSTSAALLEAARPECVLISVGRNSYGQPSEKNSRKAGGVQPRPQSLPYRRNGRYNCDLRYRRRKTMSEITLSKFREQLKTNKLGGFYIFHGEEAYLKEHYLGELRRAVLGADSAADDFNLRRFDGKKLKFDMLCDAVDAYPSFAEKTLVEVWDYDIFRSGEEAGDMLASLLEDLPEHCCLALIYDTVEYKPDKRRKKLCSVIDSRAQVLKFDMQEQEELIKWISRHFRSHGKSISADDAAYLIFLCGGLMGGLKNEIDKIAFYSRSERVTRADIDAAATPVVEAVVFDLTNELSRKNYDKAAGVMGKLFMLDEDPIKILAVVGAQIRRMYSARLIREAGLPGGEKAVLEAMKLSSPYQARLLYKECMSFSAGWYVEALRLCAETDYKIKTSAGNPEELLAALFLNLAR
jgi:DNA polymerase-3 subunit delta